MLIFWGLDGYFLWQERLFRALYNHVRAKDAADIDFSMDVNTFRTGWIRSWLGATFSRTLISFYGALVVAVGIVIICN